MVGELAQRAVYAGPLYVQIKKLLHENILSEKWSAGTLLPNESDLARAYGVSIGTMRKALQELESAGWISRRQGRGTFVMDPRHASRRRLDQFYLNGEHFSPDGFKYLSCTVERAQPKIVAALALRKGDLIIQIKRKKVIKGMIRLLEELQVPGHLLEDISADQMRRMSISDSDIQSYSSFVRRCVERVRPAFPDEECAAELELDRKTPILLCERQAFDAESNPVEWSRRFIHLEGVEYMTETL